VSDNFRIGAWLVEPSLNVVSQNSKAFHIEPKVMEVLVCLARHAGETVSKKTLIQAVWSDTFVTDDVLTRSISELRRVFDDDAKQSRFIQTIPKRGYRLVAAVETVSGTETTTVGEAWNKESAPWERRAVRRKTWLGVAAIITGALVLAGALAGFNVAGLREKLLRRTASTKIQSLAVLPLTNLSNDSAQDYFAEGMTDALITELSQIASIKVISRTSIMAYRKPDKPLSQVARELGVDGIVEGTIQRSGNQIRITAQLIYAPADRHVWANSYQHSTEDVLGLEREIAQAIAREIQAKLTPQEKARLAGRRPVSLQALETYLQGRYHLGQAQSMAFRNGLLESRLKELATARSFFEQALREDPSYAQAYVGLSDTWWDRPVAEGGPEKADTMLRKALDLDPGLAEAHQALATLDVLRLWKWSEAGQEYQRAIGLNPNYAEAHARYAEFLDMMGHFDEGMKEFLRAQDLDPGHDFNPNPFYRRRQYDRAIELDRNDVRRHAFGFWSHWNLAYDYEAAGMHMEAAQEWVEVMRILGYQEIADAMQRGLEHSGYKGALRELVVALEEMSTRGRPVSANIPAQFYAFLGEKNRAFDWLERGYLERNTAYSALNVDPCWDNLRSDPRFKDLVRRVGLPTPQAPDRWHGR
jgi:TolB-like protein/DNA-binding winged helix-turn-helix (wHTH) protein